MKNIVITGEPGVGKTTLVTKLVEQLLKSWNIEGFYTTELRDPVTGKRSGFDLISIPEERR